MPEPDLSLLFKAAGIHAAGKRDQDNPKKWMQV